MRRTLLIIPLVLAQPLLRALTFHANRLDNAALDTFKQAFPYASPHAKFLLADTLMQVDPASLRKLIPTAGVLLTYVEPDASRPPRPAFDPATRQLRLRLSYRDQAAAPQNTTLILRSVADNSETQFPVPVRIHAQSFGSDTFTITLPPAIPAGNYTLFLRTDAHDGLPSPFHLPAPAPAKPSSM
ncbi:MAG TPA: hypothetical protein VHQ47_01670 [Phycisphaerae bacterium]|nr:hypothetical protein [Phycisphaerae bacterium]